MTINFISNDEFRNMNPNLDLSKYTETTLSGVITRATAKVENYLEYTLPYETITDEKIEGYINSNYDLVIYPRKYPIDSVSSIKIVKGTYSGEINLTTTNYDIPSREDEINISGASLALDTVSMLDLETLRHNDFYVEITYNAGYQMYDRPQFLIDAINLYAKDEVSRALNASGASEVRQGGVTIKYANSKGKSDFIQDAETLLLTLKRVTGF